MGNPFEIGYISTKDELIIPFYTQTKFNNHEPAKPKSISII